MGRLDINWENIKAIYIYTPNKISIADLVKECKKSGIKVSQGAIGNRAAKEKWTEQRDLYHNKVNALVAKRLSSDLVQRRTLNLKRVEVILALGTKNYIEKLKKGKEYLDAGQLNTLLRLQEFLSGGVDSRSEKVFKLDKPLKDMTDKELEDAQTNIIETTFEVLDES